MDNNKLSDIIDFKGYRILGIDFGLKRIGLAVADELLITVTPRLTLDYSSAKFWVNLIDFIQKERIKFCVIGVPYRDDGLESEIIDNIREFISIFVEKTNLPIVEFDEAYSSIYAERTMHSIGTKKKKRQTKGEKDKIAAALILKEFIKQYEN